MGFWRFILLGVIPGPNHEYVTLLVVEFPDRVTVGVLHVMPPPMAEALGWVVLAVTVAVAVDLQLLAGLVTVSV